MIKCVIIDDEMPAIKVIEKYISQIPGLQLVGVATNPLVGIEIINEHKADVVFLDIRMDEMTGIDVISVIDKHTRVIFCTAYSEFAISSYELDVVDYLMKPIAFNRFVKAVERLKASLRLDVPVSNEEIPDDYIFIKTEQKGKLFKLDLDDIDYVEGMSNYVAFYRGKEKTLAYLSMKEVEERLPSSLFMRVHKSYVIAIKKIAMLENGELRLKNSPARIPLGATYKDAFMEKMKGKLLF